MPHEWSRTRVQPAVEGVMPTHPEAAQPFCVVESRHRGDEGAELAPPRARGTAPMNAVSTLTLPAATETRLPTCVRRVAVVSFRENRPPTVTRVSLRFPTTPTEAELGHALASTIRRRVPSGWPIRAYNVDTGEMIPDPFG
jgi:hypothetical protein